MPAHQIPYRKIVFSEGRPPFPADVETHCDLVPQELFGESDQSGKLHLLTVGQQIQLQPDRMHGGVRKRSGGRLPLVKVDTVFFDFRLQIQGARATISGRISDFSSFQTHIHTIATNLPAFLALAFKEPVEIERLTGQIAGKSFQVQVRGKYEYSMLTITTDVIAKSVCREMSHLQALPSVYKVRIFLALRYVNQARWLEYMAHYPNQFAGEGLLNLAKAIEVIFDCSGDVDKLRHQLRLLRLREDILELIISVIYVRNQVDVGHIKVGLLSLSELSDFHKLVQKATALVSWLLRHVLDEVIGGCYELPAVPVGQSKAAPLRRVAELLAKVKISDSSEYLHGNPQAGPLDADSTTNAN